jgi:hypothetical protein
LGNQQAKVTDTEYGWVAGFFDGEGSVLLSVRSKKNQMKNPKVQPGCKMQATDAASLDRMHAILERAGIAHHVSWSRPRGQMKSGMLYQMAWCIAIIGLNRTEAFLSWIMPALATKQERAALCLEYIRSRRENPSPQTPITEYELSLVQKMRTLNISKRPITLEINREPPKWPEGHHATIGAKGLVTIRSRRQLAPTTARQPSETSEGTVCSHVKA